MSRTSENVYQSPGHFYILTFSCNKIYRNRS